MTEQGCQFGLNDILDFSGSEARMFKLNGELTDGWKAINSCSLVCGLPVKEYGLCLIHKCDVDGCSEPIHELSHLHQMDEGCVNLVRNKSSHFAQVFGWQEMPV